MFGGRCFIKSRSPNISNSCRLVIVLAFPVLLDHRNRCDSNGEPESLRTLHAKISFIPVTWYGNKISEIAKVRSVVPPSPPPMHPINILVEVTL
jgi:hypothetical protein